MVEYVRDHGDNRIVIEQHVDVGEDLHFSILDSNQQTIREKKCSSSLTKRGTARLRNASGVRVGSINCG